MESVPRQEPDTHFIIHLKSWIIHFIFFILNIKNNILIILGENKLISTNIINVYFFFKPIAFTRGDRIKGNVSNKPKLK